MADLEIAGFSGPLLRPGDDGYDDARRLFNGMIDRRPALIARCTSAGDVALAVKKARSSGLALSVYGGGHGVTGTAVAEGGLCIDLRLLKMADVDPDSQTMRAGAGLTWGEFDAAAFEHELAVTGGRVSTTGISGLTLGSGSGHLERLFGFTCDSLLAAEVVTADGRIVNASADENPDLFWGLRGGGGNFGVVTTFTFQLHPIPRRVLAGMLLYPGAMAPELVRYWRDFMLSAPDEVCSALAFITAPMVDYLPEPTRGGPAVAMLLAYVGPLDEGEKVLEPMRTWGPPTLSLVEPMPYPEMQRLLDAGAPPGMQNYWTADFYRELPDEAVDTFVELANMPVSPLSQMVIIPGGGAISRVDEDAMAFGNRNAPWNVHYLSMWTDPVDTEENIFYTKALVTAMKPWSTGRVYLNFIGDEGQSRVEAAFGPEKWAKLRALKAKWDPDNLFHHNQNIPPA
jgi:FAD/FMN-containing dehydrogenase